MKGDFSRDAFGVRKHDYRMLMQQGRVQLDADWNEQMAIVLHRLETMARDVCGPAGGPEDYCGFAVFAPDIDADANFGIGAGRYYVDGILVENDRPRRFTDGNESGLEAGHAYLVYLDVWEEFIAPQQDATLLDPALDGLDTTARTRVAWRVRAHRVPALPTHADVADGWPYGFLGADVVGPSGRLSATLSGSAGAGDPALGAQPGGYHGAENQLYRVEIHDPGTSAGGATFKWSRDNAANALTIRAVADKVVTVATFARDANAALVAGDWVEIVDDDDAGARHPARPLFAVAHADPGARTVTLKTAAGYAYDARKHPILRRWDQRSAPLAVVESGPGDDAGMPLENGVQIAFASPAEGDDARVYRTGDYWMIPARTADGGSLLWPVDAQGQPLAREPGGIRHHYAPLAGIHITANGTLTIDRERHDYRRRFRPLTHRS